MASLRHPNLVEWHEAFLDGPWLCLVSPPLPWGLGRPHQISAAGHAPASGSTAKLPHRPGCHANLKQNWVQVMDYLPGGDLSSAIK